MKTRFLAPLFLLPLAGFAQETLEEISVAGNKEGRSFSETPESVTILPPSRINRGDQSNSLEVLNAQANVQVSRNAETFSIRGVNSAGVTGFQKDNLASIFVDDVFQTDLALRAGAFEVWDMESLEVYRGPQSTSQGVNSLAGAIILNRAAPQQADQAALKAGYGSFNRRELGGMANKSLFNNKFATRVSFNKDANDGFIKNKTTKNEKWGQQDKGHLVVDFKYFLDDKSELRFNNKFMKYDTGGNYTLRDRPSKFHVFENQDYTSEANSTQHSLQYTKPFSSTVQNKTTLAFTSGLQNDKTDADGTELDRLGARREYYNDQFISLENVLRYQTAKIKNALGVHAHQYRSFSHYDFRLIATATVFPRVEQDSDKTRETYAIFDSLYYKFDEHHALNLGARYEFVKNYFGVDTNAFPSGSAGVDAQLGAIIGNRNGRQDTRQFLPKLGYIYENKGHTWGATYTQGYRIGGLDINRLRATSVEYDPETTNNYELSWKTQSNRLTTQANVFYTKWSDQQVQVRLSNSTFDTQVENASGSELYGAEFESNYSWENGNILRFGVGHVKTQFVDFKNNGISYNGNHFPDAAEWTAQTAYGHRFTDRIMSNLTLRHVGESYTNAENNRRAPEQQYVDLNLQYEADSYVWEFNARNLFDEVYVLNKSNVYGQNNLWYKRTNRPRELNTRITWFW